MNDPNLLLRDRDIIEAGHVSLLKHLHECALVKVAARQTPDDLSASEERRAVRTIRYELAVWVEPTPFDYAIGSLTVWNPWLASWCALQFARHSGDPPLSAIELWALEAAEEHLRQRLVEETSRPGPRTQLGVPRGFRAQWPLRPESKFDRTLDAIDLAITSMAVPVAALHAVLRLGTHPSEPHPQLPYWILSYPGTELDR